MKSTIKTYPKKDSFLGLLARWPQLASALCAVATLMMSCIFLSYDPYDQSSYYYATEQRSIHNLLGIVGSYIAAFCFFMFGECAYLLLGWGFYATYYFAFIRSMREEYDRIIAFVTMLPACCALFYASHYGSTAYVLPGGVLGKHVFEFLHAYGNVVEIIIILYLIMISQLLILFRISFIEAGIGVKKIAYYFLSFVKNIVCTFRFLKKYALALYRYLLPYGYRFIRCFKKFYLFCMHGSESSQKTEIIKIQEQDFDDQKNAKEIVCLDAVSAEEKDKKIVQKKFELPSIDLFAISEKHVLVALSPAEIHHMTKIIEEKLATFGIAGKIIDIKQGPVITLFEYQPAIETKLSKIVALDQDIALALQAMSVRIIAPIPGTARVGFEVSNKKRAVVLLGDIMHSAAFKDSKARLPLVLGKNTTGKSVVVDLADMPHVLIAGSTGSGKSIALNAMLLSLIVSLTPEELSLIIIDPKRLEFSSYQHIPHLLFPIITDPHKAAPILRWLVKCMEDRYQMMAECGVRNIQEYKIFCKQEGIHDELSYIVVIIDELADLMMVAGKESESAIVRLAQMARAAGIHLIVATQRPSVDVITGLIKVNFPSRISFKLTSKVDSRTILDTSGAETLLGKGDMLFMDVQTSSIARVHGAYVSDTEVKKVADALRALQKPEYKDIQAAIAECQSSYSGLSDDPLLKEVLAFVDTMHEISISLLQRRFKVGYNRAANLIELLEQKGKLMPADGAKMRKVVK